MKSAINLNADAANQAIENAVRTQAQIVLEAPAFGDVTINGFLICGDNSALLIETTGRLPVPSHALVDTKCEVRVYTDQRYQFESVITSAPQWGDSRSIAISRPRAISVIERRRFLRAKLAPSTRVKLEWSHDGVNHRHVAAMLNVSPEGLACRLDDGAAAAIAGGGSIRAKFDVPGCDHSFDVESSICNKTPASEGCTILGLHFSTTADNVGEVAALREALKCPREAASTPGVPA